MDYCQAPRIDADALDAKVLEAVQDFYTNRLDDALDWRRTEGHPSMWDDQQTERVIYELGYHATGWITTGDALLANTAANQARERHLAGLDALADEHQTTLTTSQPKAA